MSIKILRKNLLAALKVVNKTSAPKSSLPILKGVYLEGKGDNTLILRSTNLEIAGTVVCPGYGQLQPIIVSARGLQDMLKSKKDDLLLLEWGNKDLTIWDEDNNCVTLPVLGEEHDFPLIPTWHEIQRFVLSNVDLLAIGQYVAPAASKDVARESLQSVLFEWSRGNPSTLTTTATDGFRLHQYKMDAQCPNAGAVESFLIPVTALKIAATVLGKLRGDEYNTVAIRVMADDRDRVVGWQIESTFGEIVFTGLMGKGKYVNYEPIIPKHSFMTASFDAAAWRDALAGFKGYNQITIDASIFGTAVWSGKDGNSQVTTTLPLNRQSGSCAGVVFGINPSYLAAAIPPTRRPTLSYRSCNEPLLIVDGTFLAVVMPMSSIEVG